MDPALKHRQATAPLVPVDQFQSELRSICGLFDVEPGDRSGAISGAASLFKPCRLDIADVRLDALKVARGPTHIKRDHGEHFFAILQMGGQCSIRQGDNCKDLRHGELCIVDSAQPSEFVYNGTRSHQISFHLPREEMLRRFGMTFDAWSYLPEAKFWFPPIFEIVKRLMSAREDIARQHLEESFLSMLGAALSEMSGGEAPLARQGNAMLHRALSLIEQKCTEPNYTPARLAGDLDISPRTLQRHFKLLGETPGRRLLDARLACAHKLLASKFSPAGNSVTEIAYASGFSDLSHFHREFRAKYDLTPGELRSRN